MSLASKLHEQKKQDFEERVSASKVKFRAVLQRMQEDQDLSDLRAYGVLIRGDEDEGIIEFSVEEKSLNFVVNRAGYLILDGLDVSEQSAGEIRYGICNFLTNGIIFGDFNA